MNISRRPKTMPVRRQVAHSGRPVAFSYHSRRSEQPAALGRNMFREALNVRNAKRVTHYWRQRFGVLVVAAAVCLGLYQLLVLSSDPKVVTATDHATFIRPTPTYHDAVQKLLAGSILNSNKLTVDVNGVSGALKRQYPELSTVTISLPLIGHRPIVYVASADPALVLLSSDGHAFVVDANGRAVAQVPTGSVGNSHLPIVKDASTAAYHVGQLAISSDAVGFIKQILYQVEQKRLSVSTFGLPAGSSELDMYLDGQHYFVKFNMQSDSALEQVGDYLAVRHYLESRGVSPSEYVDVRITGRAYYK